MTVDGRRWTKRVAAGKHLRDVLAHRIASTPPETTGKPQPDAQLGGLDIHVQATTVIQDELRILIPDVGNEIRLVGSELATIDPTGLIRRIEHPIHRLPDTITDLRRQRGIPPNRGGIAYEE